MGSGRPPALPPLRRGGVEPAWPGWGGAPAVRVVVHGRDADGGEAPAVLFLLLHFTPALPLHISDVINSYQKLGRIPRVLEFSVRKLPSRSWLSPRSVTDAR